VGLIWTTKNLQGIKIQMANAINRNPARRLISVSREPRVLANQHRELAVPSNLAQLRNQ
jgi:hypothetical protein